MQVERPNRPAAIVHIGYHKTATTWLQDEVFPKAASHRFVPRKTVQQAFLHPCGLHFETDRARAVLGLDEDDTPLLLSEENLSGYLHNGGLHGFLAPEIARRIQAVLPDARIVIFIRNQFEICRASYAQYVSGGGTWSPRRYFETSRYVRGALTRPWKAPAFEFEHFEFDRLIAHYDRLLGAERVHVYAYEWLARPDALLDRMERDLGLRLETRPAAGARANPSLGAMGQRTLRFVNLFTRQSVVNKRCIVDVPGGQGLRHAAKFAARRLPRFVERTAGLPVPVRERIASHFPESNRRLMAMRDLPLEELGYPL
ncbi:hypothetical protein [Novosphingobium album (ex Liu et al. 2023)]|uniref:Sulfotransferase n=1 Tax=Novosphingobium album (ex Liu et al. 2023) TaxID=3031130 RepID=A0ABT5WSP3_9SPHN|nr:hypothetical protein [Novosphingobium album (ex Liu et al. 2023)]MDE8653059.1 hypothetical protein [Novosphingobium album (ex Liu et al. 2023)]